MVPIIDIFPDFVVIPPQEVLFHNSSQPTKASGSSEQDIVFGNNDPFSSLIGNSDQCDHIPQSSPDNSTEDSDFEVDKEIIVVEQGVVASRLPKKHKLFIC